MKESMRDQENPHRRMQGHDGQADCCNQWRQRRLLLSFLLLEQALHLSTQKMRTAALVQADGWSSDFPEPQENECYDK